MATYFAVLFQLLFPLLVAIRETRLAALFLAVLFHMGIAILMGLTSFSIYMIATEAVLLSDSHYRRLGTRIDRWMERTLSHSRRIVEGTFCDRYSRRDGQAVVDNDQPTGVEERRA